MGFKIVWEHTFEGAVKGVSFQEVESGDFATLDEAKAAAKSRVEKEIDRLTMVVDTLTVVLAEI